MNQPQVVVVSLEDTGDFSSWLMKQSCAALARDYHWAGSGNFPVIGGPKCPARPQERKGPSYLPDSLSILRRFSSFSVFST